jgi:flagellar basal-body rod modification protein FlgD
MTVSSTTSTTANSVLDSLSLDKKKSEEPKKNELGQDAFLQLLVTQMNNQNPLNPQDNSEFVAQLAQFSSVEGITKLNGQMEDMSSSFQSSTALQASALVGRQVLVPGEKLNVTSGSPVKGIVDVEASTSQLTLNVYNDTGVLVRQEIMGSTAAGSKAFTWDGKDSNGNPAPTGKYTFKASAIVDGKAKDQVVNLPANVNSVTLGKGGAMTLNVEGVGAMSLESVKEIL